MTAILFCDLVIRKHGRKTSKKQDEAVVHPEANDWPIIRDYYTGQCSNKDGHDWEHVNKLEIEQSEHGNVTILPYSIKQEIYKIIFKDGEINYRSSRPGIYATEPESISIIEIGYERVCLICGACDDSYDKFISEEAEQILERYRAAKKAKKAKKLRVGAAMGLWKNCCNKENNL